jgi:hypothetical protein
MKDKLSDMIQNAVGGCAKYWADVIADKLLSEGVSVPQKATDGETNKSIGSLEFYCNDLDKKISIHDYLIELLKTLWEEQDEFSGKRPFGNSGWDYDLIGCLIANNIIDGKLDEEYGYIIEGDTHKGYALIKEYIESLQGGAK